MTKNNKILPYIFVIIILVVSIAVGKKSMTMENSIDVGINQDEKIEVYLDDKLMVFADKPVVKEDKVYVPVEEFTTKIGAETEFKKSNKVIIKKEDKNLVIDTKDHTAITQDNESFFIGSIDKGKKVLLPIDIIANYFGFNVSDLIKNTIKVYSDSKEIDEIESDEKLEENQMGEKKEQENNNTKVTDEKPKEDENNIPETKEKIAYLTFDDGPNANTPQILDVLKEKNVKATFFMLGSSIISHGDIAKRVHDEGHSIGLHSMTHNYKSVYASPYSFLNEMNATNDVLGDATGSKSLLIRAPYGSKPYMKEEFRDLTSSWGYRVWDWNVDSRDSIKANTKPEEVYNEVVSQVANKSEAVILFHDRDHTLKALPKIIDYLESNGFEMKKIDKGMTPLNFWNDIR